MFPIAFYPIFSWAKWKHLHVLKIFCDGPLKVAPYHPKQKKTKKSMRAFYPTTNKYH
jgi:hypothetical protein